MLTGFDNDVQLAVMDEGKKQGIKYVVLIRSAFPSSLTLHSNTKQLHA